MNLTGVGLLFAEQNLDQGGLARPVVAHQRSAPTR